MMQREGPEWWQGRAFVVAVALAAMIPLLWPTVPPLVDLPGHMGRYRVQLSIDANPWLNGWYDFQWQLIGNLGVDLLIIPLAKVFGLELAVKLIVLTIPTLTVGGLLWIAREVHGRIPPTALFALPLGLLVAWCLLAIVNVKAFGWRLPFHVFPLQLIELLAVAMAAALCAAALPVARLARMQPATLIRTFVNER